MIDEEICQHVIMIDNLCAKISSIYIHLITYVNWIKVLFDVLIQILQGEEVIHSSVEIKMNM